MANNSGRITARRTVVIDRQTPGLTSSSLKYVANRTLIWDEFRTVSSHHIVPPGFKTTQYATEFQLNEMTSVIMKHYWDRILGQKLDVHIN